jgi:hypothetical protein
VLCLLFKNFIFILQLVIIVNLFALICKSQSKNVILFQLVIIVTTWEDTNGPPDVVVDAFSAFSESTGTINFDKNEGEVR